MPRIRRRLPPAVAVSLLIVAVVAAGAGCASMGQPPSPQAAVVPRPAHVVVAVFENHSAADVLGAGSSAPSMRSLAAAGASFSDSHGVTHPSQPNYLALFSGSTHGVTSDTCPTNLGGRANLGRQLVDAGLSFTGYSEGLRTAGFTGCGSGAYARKHNPWVDFSNLPGSSNQPFSAFPTDFGRLPTVSFVVPDLCNDMHDCPVATGDTWLRTHLGAYARWARTHDSLLIVTFDEDDFTASNQIPTFFSGPMVKPGTYSEPVTHYRLLRTLEAMYGLPPLGSAATTAPIGDIWK
jgi:acid phosphatase